MMKTVSKANAGAAAGGIVGALAALLTALFDIEPEAAATLAGAAGMLIGWLTTYFAPSNRMAKSR